MFIINDVSDPITTVLVCITFDNERHDILSGASVHVKIINLLFTTIIIYVKQIGTFVTVSTSTITFVKDRMSNNYTLHMQDLYNLLHIRVQNLKCQCQSCVSLKSVEIPC